MDDLDDEQEAIGANAAFYAAFRQRDMTAMADIWSREQLVVCAHPGWQLLYGREAVMASWRAILVNPDAPPIEHEHARVLLHRDVAVVTCVERIFESRLVATNVFVREKAGFRLVHHHAGPFSEQADAERERPLN